LVAAKSVVGFCHAGMQERSQESRRTGHERKVETYDLFGVV
jgi:hypothetical protein